jgi:hypothetical protein
MSIIVLAPTLLDSLFPSSKHGYRTSVLAELSFRMLKNLELAEHSDPRGFMTVFEEIADAFIASEKLSTAMCQAAFHRPVTHQAVNASKSRLSTSARSDSVEENEGLETVSHTRCTTVSIWKGKRNKTKPVSQCNSLS